VKLPALFGYGFRPFFLAAGIAAVMLVPWWAGSVTLGIPLETAWPGALWHGHEMVFGFVVAAISGFLLTAVPSWTGQRGFSGWPLVLLAGLWLGGRLLVASSARWPALLTAGVDLAFLPVLALTLLPTLVRARSRNTPLLLALLALCATNAVFYWAVGHADQRLARNALLTAVNVVLLLVTVIGGRIVPAFTSSGLKEQQADSHPLKRWPGLSALAIGAMLADLLVDLTFPDRRAAGVCALAAAVIQAVRLVQWQGLRTFRLPLVWVLHVAYAWLPVGLALKAVALLTAAPFAAFWLHALTIGAAATMIIAVITRASLGHTGRPLRVGPPTVLAYLLLTAAGVVRTFGPAVAVPYALIIALTAALWTSAFALFLWIYGPILLTPRVDGKPG